MPLSLRSRTRVTYVNDNRTYFANEKQKSCLIILLVCQANRYNTLVQSKIYHYELWKLRQTWKIEFYTRIICQLLNYCIIINVIYTRICRTNFTNYNYFIASDFWHKIHSLNITFVCYIRKEELRFNLPIEELNQYFFVLISSKSFSFAFDEAKKKKNEKKSRRSLLRSRHFSRRGGE